MEFPSNLTSGSADLDNDIRSLYALLSVPASLAKATEAASNPSLKYDELQQVIPKEVIDVILALTDDTEFQLLLAQCRETAKEPLKRARQAASEHFSSLRTHPSLADVVQRRQAAISTKEDQQPLLFNTIAHIGYMPTYTGFPPKLKPAMRVAFRDARGKLLLDSTLEWDDIIRLSSSFAALAVKHLEETSLLREANAVELDKRVLSKMASEILDLSKQLTQLKQLAPAYGVDLSEKPEVRGGRTGGAVE